MTTLSTAQMNTLQTYLSNGCLRYRRRLAGGRQILQRIRKNRGPAQLLGKAVSRGRRPPQGLRPAYAPYGYRIALQ